ncbi:MAG: NUDIX domain-containing protein [Patescibacteria group bacterium]|jgi:8-oxo-dGTP pyrophosphatase MutT (NUDIX family)
MKIIQMTVMYPIDEAAHEVLLGFKKKNIGKGLYNGPGGSVEEHETLTVAALREMHEEVGENVQVTALQYMGILYVTFEDTDSLVIIHYFVGYGLTGEPEETGELIPRRFSLDAIPFHQMWPNDPFMMPFMINGQCMFGLVQYNNIESRRMLSAHFSPITREELEEALPV